MAQQHINLGTQSDGKDGDTNRVAWAKAEANFGELYGGALAAPSFKNLIVNGGFDIWQRGTSGFATTGYFYTADRWKALAPGSSAVFSRQSFAVGQSVVPDNPKYFLRCAVTSAAGPGNCVVLAQFIEGAGVLSGKTVTVSFWAKADSARRIGVSIDQNPGTGGSASAQVSGAGRALQLSSDWQKFVLAFDVPSIAGMVLGSNANDSTSINFWMDAGSTYSGRSGGIGQQSGTFDVAQVQVEIGSYATSFGARPLGVELALCQRYARLVQGGGMTGVALSPTAILLGASWPTMRATPSITLLKTSWSAASYELLVGGTWATAASCTLQGPSASPQGVTVQVLGFSGLTTGQPAIISNATANVLLLDAEL